MMFGTYCRIESAAGGCSCTNRQFVKACHGVMNTKGKSRRMRETRHIFIRQGLESLKEAQGLYLDVLGGRI